MVGPVLEVDEDWRRYLRARVQVNIQHSLLDDIIVSTPNGDTIIEFYYEQLPDYCWICGLSPGFEGSLLRGSLGGFVSPNHGARPAGSGIRGNGSQSVPSKSVTGGGVAFRNHVDTMVLGGKPVARKGSSDNRRRDRRLEGGYGMPSNARNREAAEGSQMRQYMEGGGKNRGSGVRNIEESSGEAPLAAETNLLGRKVTYSVSNSKIGAGTSGPILGQDIPGVGPSVVGLGQGDVGHAIVALRGKEAASKANEVSKFQRQVSKNTTTISTDESYDSSFPFVFGAGG
ncbi:hypothetical protein COLO4_36772 [Corchorus olitorius]|uniref:Zinc knuckle CX2CX4HX4C n=1 Tax=Corchorus olitorius TaxID=93759 RepID=A0A1R3G5H5_9ROSI|nr:hypothetical protein COLO4_36772 [Corchorus olitorius]